MKLCHSCSCKVNIEYNKAIEHYELGQTMLMNPCQG